METFLYCFEAKFFCYYVDDELIPRGTGVSSELISFVFLALTLWRDAYRFIMEESASPLNWWKFHDQLQVGMKNGNLKFRQAK